MALMKVKGNLERLFDKNLGDLVRGIRNNKDDEARYIAACLEEIKAELRQQNAAVKANAVAKLTYLQMLGYEVSWAGFNVVEVMSSVRFTEKRLGYLAASQSFRPDTDVLMLTTNMIRKDLNSPNQYDAGVALSSLSCFISPDLARDLSADIMTMLTSTKPYLRKKAVLILYKVFLRYPDALRPAFPRLREKLEDPDPGVQSAAVNVICELARKNPKNYLSLAPTFFKLMTTSTNNWMLIKIIKLFGALTPLEPRLGNKLIGPLTNLIHSTSAMSLLYECINTVIAVLISISSGMPNHTSAIQLCVQKLRVLIEDSDQNLKYLGLLAMSKILKTHPKSVQGHKDLIMQCLDDSDESIRLRALDLLYGMVTKKNLMEIVKKLMLHMQKAEGTTYRDELMEKIVGICSQNDYQFVTNFEWYVTVLVDLTRAENGACTRHGPLIAAQMMDVAIRVETVRGFAVKQMALLVENAHLLLAAGSGAGGAAGGQRNSAAEVLYAACWICGEFAPRLSDPADTLRAMFRGKLMSLPGHIQAVYIQNGLKLFTHIVKSGNYGKEEIVALARSMEEVLSTFLLSSDLEVQERASSAYQIVKYALWRLEKGEGEESVIVQSLAGELSLLFTGELNPVGPKAQKKVPLPEGLNLDAWINEPPPDSEEEEEEDVGEGGYNVFMEPARSPSPASVSKKGKKKKRDKKEKELTEEEVRQRREARLLEQSMNPNYLKDSPRSPARSSATGGTGTPVEDIPIQNVDLGVPLQIPGLASADQYVNISRDSSETEGNGARRKKTKKSKKKHRRSTTSEDDQSQQPTVAIVKRSLEMPEGAVLSDEDEEDQALPEDDPHRALANVRLDDIEYNAPYKASEDSSAGAATWRGGEGDASIPTSLFGAGDAKKKSKKKKNQVPEETLDEDKTKKKKRKKHKHKDNDLVNGDEEHNGDGDGGEERKKAKKKKKKKEKETDGENAASAAKSSSSKTAAVPDVDDIDYWLSNNEAK